MRCDMHVHTIHSGMCTLPVLSRVCRESYTEPDALYARLKRAGMDLVTVTDHDSIDAAEALRSHDDFFLSEEVTCRMPSGTEIHLGVYDIADRHHVEIQRRRTDIESLAAYLDEQGLFFTINHLFSCLTGRRHASDFDRFEALFPGFETLNGHMLGSMNRRSAELADLLAKAPVAGSDAHTLSSAGLAWTSVPGARTKAEFLEAVRRGRARAIGASGTYWKLTSDVFRICASMARENPATLLLAPLAALVPAAIAVNYTLEAVFLWQWTRRLGWTRPRTFAGDPGASPAVAP
ncbi:MAG TPA: PHP-associated domain-containing protein [Bryobacteraceae bacterium]|nr:PHP-associated domain-containing protein [Bryobacteraceae bacterium]